MPRRENPPGFKVCARPGCKEIIKPAEGSSKGRKYHSNACRLRATWTGDPKRLRVATAGVLSAGLLAGLLITLNQDPHSRPRPVGDALPAPTRPLASPTTPAPRATRTPRPYRVHPRRVVVAPVANTSPVSQSPTSPTPQPTTTPVQPTPSPTPTPAPQPRRVRRPASFTAVAGIGCPASARYGTVVTQGWYTEPSGGYTGAGCSGMYLNKWAHPLSMHMYRTLTWWFLTDIKRRTTCRVAVYIPKGNTTTVGASPARYTVLTGQRWTPAGSFTLNQPNHQGKWLYAGAFRSRAGRVAVRVTNVGYGSVMVAADAVGVDCVA